MDTVLIAVDGRESMAALAPAAEIARRWPGRVVIVHTGGLNEQERAPIDEVVRRLRNSGVETDLEMPVARAGQAAAMIAESARRRGASVILLATCSPADSGPTAAKSITQGVLDIAPCRVVVVPPHSLLDPAGWFDRPVAGSAMRV